MAIPFLTKLFAGKWARVASYGLALFSILLVAVVYFIKKQYVVYIEFRPHEISAIDPTGWELVFDFGLIVVLGLSTFFLTLRAGIYAAFPLIVLLSLAFLGLAYWMFAQGYWVSSLYPLLAILVSWLIAGSYRFWVLEPNARELKSIFSAFRSDKLAARLEQTPEEAKLGGDNKEVTIIFADIKNFTAFSEVHTPQEVVARLNEYLGVMVQVIEEFDGYVDKFIGDGIMAYWGAPLPQSDHANLAVACVLAMRDAMGMLHDKWRAEGMDPFEIRVGMQSGEVVAGNIGLRGKKMEYTVIGDAVNLASRLESSSNYYGVDTLVGDSTYRLTSDVYAYRELDKVRLLGKQVPVTVYELIGPQTGGENRLPMQFAGALSVYRACRWEEAAQLFTAILAEFPADKPSAIYLERCQYFIKNPVAPDWDGVFNRRAK